MYDEEEETTTTKTNDTKTTMTRKEHTLNLININNLRFVCAGCRMPDERGHI